MDPFPGVLYGLLSYPQLIRSSDQPCRLQSLS